MNSATKVRSISRRVAVSLALLIALVSCLIVVFMYFHISRESQADLESEADEHIAYLAGSLELPLWNQDKDTVALIGSTIYQNHLIAKLKITDALGNVIVTAERDAGAEKVERSTKIWHRSVLAGTVEFALTTRIHQARVRDILNSFALAALLIVVCLALATGFIVRAILRRPLGELNGIVDSYSAGVFRPPGAKIGYREFQPVGRVLAQMGDRISAQLEQLKEAEQRYRSIFEHAMEGIFQCTPEGRYLSANPALARIQGYAAPENLIAAASRIGLSEEDWTRFRLDANAHDFVERFEAAQRSMNGTEICVSINARVARGPNGQVVYYEGSLEDVTERKRAEQSLFLMNYALNNVRESVFLTDENGRFLFVNEEACRVRGYTREEMLRLSVPDIDPDFSTERWPSYWATLKVQQSIVMENHHMTKDGQLFPVEISANYFEYKNTGYNLALIRDISERKRTEAKVLQLNCELERRVTERTADLEQVIKELEAFSYSVSHDLRAPLRAIDGFAHLLLEGYSDGLDTEGKRYLDLVRQNTAYMGRLIDDMLAFSRMSHLGLATETVDMTALTREVFEELIAETPERNVRFAVGDLPPSRGDRDMIHRVLFNVLDNALKYSSPKPEPSIEVTGITVGGENIYCVKDNGVGFDMRYANKLFGLFQRLHSPGEFEGTGIGLAIVKRIIERHGGRIWAEGKVGEGAEVHFTLPRRKDITAA